MTDGIQSVADTAFWVAAYRARETRRPDALFRDPLAERLVQGKGEAIERSMAHAANNVAWSVAIRTVIIDELLARAFAEGCDAVLNLGAGLDTRPYRLDVPAGVQWLEVDVPEVVAFKAARLEGETPRCALTRLSADLGDEALRRRVLDDAATRGRRVFVLTEGVVPYLTEAQVAALADDLHARPAFTWWLAERYSPFFLAFRERTGITRNLEHAPFRFAPQDSAAFFTAHGWDAELVRYHGVEARRLGRPGPDGVPWTRRLAAWFMPPAQREAFATMSGYALLRPRR